METTGTTFEVIDQSGFDAGGYDFATRACIRYDLDLATAPHTRAVLRAFCSGPVLGRWLLVEFDRGRFVAVSGLHVLLEAAAAVRLRGGEFGVVDPPSSLRRMHSLLGLGMDLPLFDRAQADRIFGAGNAAGHLSRNGAVLPEIHTPLSNQRRNPCGSRRSISSS